MDFLRAHDEDRPFFLNISFVRPHSPYTPPQSYFDMYWQDETPAPYVGEWSAMHDDPATAVDPDAWRGKMTPRQIHRARSGYYGDVSFIDTQIGRLLNMFRRNMREMYQNTWFVFVSDHGDMLGDHNMWRKTYAYEGSARIPFVVVPPAGQGRPSRAVADEVVRLSDVMPTLLAGAGLSVPGTVDGRDLRPLMDAPADDWRAYIHGEHCRCYSPEQEMQYVTDGRRKFIWLPRIDREQFFDLEQDPGEVDDLIEDASRREEIETWRGYLVQELSKRDCGWVRDGRPYCPPDDPLVSPYRDVRWQGQG